MTSSDRGRTWFRCQRVRPQARVRLVCFPHAGGAASFYRRWPRRLPDGIELLAVQYPGREDRIRDPHIGDMETLADRVADALRPALDRPVALFGHSLGAAVAYEVARRIAACSTSLAALFVSGRPAPRLERAGGVHEGGDDVLWAELERLGGTSEVVRSNPELRALLLPALRNDYRLSETYRPGPITALDCAVAAYLGRGDPEVTVGEARAWGALAGGPFHLRVFEGDHFYLVPHEGALVDDIVLRLGERPAEAAWPSTP